MTAEVQDAAALPAIVPKESALEVFTTAKGLDPYLAKVRAEIDTFKPDATTKKGRDAIASMAYKVARTKTALDDVGKELVAELKKKPGLVDAERKRMRDLLDSWKDEVRKPLTDWEDAENARIESHREALEAISTLAANATPDRPAEALRALLASAEAVSLGERWQEFEAEAGRRKDAAVTALRAALTAREKHEAEQEELARLRAEAAAREQKEREERIAREATERAQKEAAAQAQAEREAVIRREAEAKAAADRRELELKLQAETAEREKAEAQRREEQVKREVEERERRAAEAERQRIAAEQAQAAAELARRERDKAHKATVNRAAVVAFVNGGMTEECAKQAVTLIAKKSIPAISINY